jgi:N6-adenosine-specific RNA methylase IME4
MPDGELVTLATTLPQSPAAALQALIRMERELDDAKTYAEIRKVVAIAEAFKKLFAQVEDVRRQAEQTIVLALARVGEELAAQPVATGTRGQLVGPGVIGGTPGGPPIDTPTLANQVGSKNRGLRLKKLATSGKDVLVAAVAKLHQAGKEATVTTVLKALHGDDKRERRAERETSLAAATIAASEALSTRLYGVLYADPPWRFEPYSRETGMDRAAENHYPTMGLDAIKSMTVPAADDCVLFLWATIPMLPQALEVMSAWGFAYKSQFVWTKDKIGPGYWVREQHELLLIGTRGAVPAPAPGAQYASVQSAKRGEHSAKPFLFREIIDDYFPTVPKLEMFARAGDAFVGWDRWGNEVQSAAD